MAPQPPPTLEDDVPSSSNPASTPPRDSPKTQDASTDTHSPRRDSGYESPSLPSTPPRRSRTSNPDAPPLQQTMSSTRTSSRPSTSHRSSSSTRRPSRPSRRSSFLLQPLPQPPLPRPQLHPRAASENHLHLRHNPFLPPSSSTPATPKTPRVCSFPSPTQHHHSSNHHHHSPSLPCTNREASYSNYHPAPPIDWTLPSTRRKENEARERERRGLKGLWRRILPRSCIRNQSAVFFASEKEGSVRRLRLDFDDGKKEEGEGWEKEGGDGGAEDEVALKGMRVGRRGVSGWVCWGIGRGERQGA